MAPPRQQQVFFSKTIELLKIFKLCNDKSIWSFLFS